MTALVRWLGLALAVVAAVGMVFVLVRDEGASRGDRVAEGPETDSAAPAVAAEIASVVEPTPGAQPPLQQSGPRSASLVANPSVEVARTDGAPSDWKTGTFGDHQAAFAYETSGIGGARSVSVTVSDHRSGDAKWYPDPVPVIPGGEYQFSHYYRSTVETQVWLVRYDSAGREFFDLLDTVPSAREWQEYSTSFAVGPDTSSVTIFHVLSGDGTLIVDDYFLAEATTSAGFERGLLTLTFDDAWAVNSGHALETLESFGFTSTLFVATDAVDTTPGAVDAIRRFLVRGHELGSHSVSHSDLTALTASGLEAELTESRRRLEALFDVEVDYFATPFGTYDTAVLSAIMDIYDVHRSTSVGYNTPANWDPSRLRVRNIRSTTTAAEVRGWVEQAQQHGWWLVLLYHDVQPDPGEFDSTPDAFDAQMAEIAQTGIEVVTMTEALDELRPQLD